MNSELMNTFAAGVSVLATDGLPGASCHSKQAGLSLNDSLPLKAGERQVSDVCLSEAAIRKPRKLLALSYNYSDSDNEESREERRMRCVSSISSSFIWLACPCDFCVVVHFRHPQFF